MTRVKVCGIRRLEDAELAVTLGASAVGFVLWDRSPRHIGICEASKIARALPPFVTRVGVFVDAAPQEVTAAVREIGLDAIQLHGDERVEEYEAVPARVIKAVSPGSAEDVTAAIALPAGVSVLIDADAPVERGGTGRPANWTRAAEIARARPILLAGGLTAASVTDAIRQVRPWAVDVSSGVEDAPGIKSARRMQEFFAAVGAA
jgi:phosphoribosylanthranilate isomerase